MSEQDRPILPQLPFSLGDPKVSSSIAFGPSKSTSYAAWERVPNLGIKWVLWGTSHLIWAVIAVLISAAVWRKYTAETQAKTEITDSDLRY